MSVPDREIVTTIAIHAPIETVWAVLTDYPGYARWNPYLVSIEGAAVAGTTIIVRQVPRPGAAAIVAPVDVVAVAPYTMRWIGGMPDRADFAGDHRFELDRAGGHVTLVHRETFSGRQADAILAAYRDAITDNFERFNAALKATCEATA